MLQGQEICDDGMDNDGDGLVDLNDDDCECITAQPVSLIPNPSFEERSCCPTNEAMLFCADDWIQASQPTTDYVHTCGILGNTYLGYEAPLPFPDGQGAIGFRDGKPGQPNFKEYAGACLTEPLLKGLCYRIDFFVGFHDEPGSDQFPMAIFAAPQCSSLPFGSGNQNFGCPTNGPGWDLIGELEVEGFNEWKRVVFEFVPEEDYEAIVMGPGCVTHPNVNRDPYFYFDNLTIADKREFGIPFSNISGEVCDGTVVLQIESDLASNYQWYYNNVAIVGETSPSLGIASGFDEGVYQATIINDDGCFLSESYLFELPVLESFEQLNACRGETIEFGSQSLTTNGTYTEIYEIGELCDSVAILEISFEPIENSFTQEICEGDSYSFAGLELTDSDNYNNTFVLESGCDSIVILDLVVNPNTESINYETICEDEIFLLVDEELTESGLYTSLTENQFGCDSIINLELTVLNNLEYLIMQDTVTIELGDIVDVAPDDYSYDAERFTWTNRQGDILSETANLNDLSPINDEWYFLDVLNRNNCNKKDSILLKVVRNVRVYVPNVFTPESQDVNSDFLVGYNKAVTGFNFFRIYDRWGELVYIYKGTVDNYTGWDGYFNGKKAEQGVYTYLFEAQILDNTIEQYSGTITLLH